MKSSDHQILGDFNDLVSCKNSSSPVIAWFVTWNLSNWILGYLPSTSFFFYIHSLQENLRISTCAVKVKLQFKYKHVCFFNVIRIISEKKVEEMKEEGERIHLRDSQRFYTFSIPHNFFYSNSINSADNSSTASHAVMHKQENKKHLLRSTFRHVKVCVPLITYFVEEHCT